MSVDAESPAGTDHERGTTRTDLVLEREKIELERERLALERERLAAEREKWKSDAVWKNRAEGRFGISLANVVLMAVTCVAIGGLVGGFIIWRDARTMRGRQLSPVVLKALGVETNRQGAGGAPLVLRRVVSSDGESQGGYILFLD